MSDEIYTDPLGRKFQVFTGAEFNKLFGVSKSAFHSDEARLLIPVSEPDSQLEFPSGASLKDIYYAAASGTVIHKIERDISYGPQKPPKILETEDGLRPEGNHGFAATSLNVFNELDWFGECWGVMEAHGWHDRKGDLGQNILDRVLERLGACTITNAKLEFREDWQMKVAELAATEFVQPLSRLWYAVNMMSLYYCHRDDLRLGYLWAEYRMRMHVEKNALRGERTAQSARAGGVARRLETAAKSDAVIAAMSKRVSAGQSIANAARLAFKE